MSGVRARDLPLALWGLLRVGLSTRGRLGGAYWRWRRDTAFGGFNVGAGERRRAMLEYGLWVARSRRFLR